jgi:flagellar biosynthesis GTPase FlhF
LQKTGIHFVRCLKPNNNKQADQFHGAYVLQQLRNTGILETIQVRKSGFAFRTTFETFAIRFAELHPSLSGLDAVRHVLQVLPPSQHQAEIGRTKIFLSHAYLTSLDEENNAALFRKQAGGIIRSAGAVYLANKRELIRRHRATLLLQTMCRKYLAKKRQLAAARMIARTVAAYCRQKAYLREQWLAEEREKERRRAEEERRLAEKRHEEQRAQEQRAQEQRAQEEQRQRLAEAARAQLRASAVSPSLGMDGESLRKSVQAVPLRSATPPFATPASSDVLSRYSGVLDEFGLRDLTASSLASTKAADLISMGIAAVDAEAVLTALQGSKPNQLMPVLSGLGLSRYADVFEEYGFADLNQSTVVTLTKDYLVSMGIEATDAGKIASALRPETRQSGLSSEAPQASLPSNLAQSTNSILTYSPAPSMETLFSPPAGPVIPAECPFCGTPNPMRRPSCSMCDEVFANPTATAYSTPVPINSDLTQSKASQPVSASLGRSGEAAPGLDPRLAAARADQP